MGQILGQIWVRLSLKLQNYFCRSDLAPSKISSEHCERNAVGCQKPRTDISGSPTFVFLERLPFLWPPCRTLIFYGNWDLFQWGMCEEILWACCEQKQNVQKFPSSVCQFRWQATLTWLVLDGQYFLGKAYHSVRKKRSMQAHFVKEALVSTTKSPLRNPWQGWNPKGS